MFLTTAIKKANEFAKKGVTIVTHGLNIWVAQHVDGGQVLPASGETGATQWNIPHPTKEDKTVSFTSLVKEGNKTELQNGASIAVAVLSDGTLKNFLEGIGKSFDDYNLSDLQKFLTSEGLESRDIRTIAPVVKSMIKDNHSTKNVVGDYVASRDLALKDGAKINKAREFAVKAVLNAHSYAMPVRETVSPSVGQKLTDLLADMAGMSDGEQMIQQVIGALNVDNIQIATVLGNVIAESKIQLAS